MKKVELKGSRVGIISGYVYRSPGYVEYQFLQEQSGGTFILTRGDGNQGRESAHPVVSCGRVRIHIGSGLSLGMARVAVGVRGLSPTDL